MILSLEIRWLMNFVQYWKISNQQIYDLEWYTNEPLRELSFSGKQHTTELEKRLEWSILVHGTEKKINNNVSTVIHPNMEDNRRSSVRGLEWMTTRRGGGDGGWFMKKCGEVELNNGEKSGSDT